MTGHHHLLINVDLPEDLSQPIAADKNHIHFGLGQTEAEITLDKGAYRLRLLMGNYLHIPHDDPLFSEEIIIIVSNMTEKINKKLSFRELKTSSSLLPTILFSFYCSRVSC